MYKNYEEYMRDVLGYKVQNSNHINPYFGYNTYMLDNKFFNEQTNKINKFENKPFLMPVLPRPPRLKNQFHHKNF